MGRKLTPWNGDFYKSPEEYNPNGLLHGIPYYRASCVDGTYYIWSYDIEKEEYVLINTLGDHRAVYEEVNRLSDEIRQRRREYGAEWYFQMQRDWRLPNDDKSGD